MMAKWTSYKVFFLTVVLYQNAYGENPTHPDIDLSFEEKVIKHGYPIEIHQINTEDDYILSLYHIPYGLKKSHTERENKSIVLLIHGMGGSPSNFIIIGSKKSAPYYFADRGFDVWVFCARGVEGSFEKKHKKWDWNKNNEYWLYSLHEIGVYDLTATIDYVLNKTLQKRLFLIGHSAGGNEIFSMLSERPAYNDKVKMAVSWASSPIIKRSDYPLMIFLSDLVDFWKGMYKYLGVTELFPQVQPILISIMRELCADPNWKKVCVSASWIIGSHKSVLQHPDDIELIAALAKTRVATQQSFHFMENFNAGEFRKYNHGPKKNMKIYGQKYPPKYNLSACTIPVAFFVSSTSDSIILKEDIYESVEYIPNVVMVYEIPFKKFSHTDYLFARNASTLVYEPTYKLFKDFDEGKLPPRISVPTKDDQ